MSRALFEVIISKATGVTARSCKVQFKLIVSVIRNNKLLDSAL